jgi:metal-sulfur cluster biosynthetic enzyme
MITAATVWNHLQTLEDPMFGIPISVVDVGLVHQISVQGCHVHIAILMFNRGRVYIDRAASPMRRHVLQLEGGGRSHRRVPVGGSVDARPAFPNGSGSARL